MADARVHRRYEVQAYVDVTGTDVLLYHHIENLSLGGICIKTATLEEVGALVDVVINFPDLDAAMMLTGKVVWVNRAPPQDMGIRWLDLDAERRVLLERYLDAVRVKEATETGPESTTH